MPSASLSGRLLRRALTAALGGLFGAGLGHAVVILAYRLNGDVDLWLKGTHGPPFFNLAADTAIFYACLAAGVAARRRLRSAIVAFSLCFAAIVVPMALCTHLFAWGENAETASSGAWLYVVLACYSLACALAVAAAGAYSSGGPARAKAGATALIGAFAAYLFGMILVRNFPWIRPNAFELSLIAPAASWIDGALNGLCVGIGALFGSREQPADSLEDSLKPL